ncbi:MAG: hypothetical protein NT170_03970 [Candidatus Moranbacteria bacterium]|nr:hypothetical protein [Candidatus Moranbacteria bacterium]
MKKLLAIIGITFLALPKITFAVCPVCTVAVGAGLGLAEYFGIDDSISGIWIGALIVSMSLWTIDWLDKKNIRFKGRKILIFLGYYAVVALPLWLKGKIGHPLHTIWGIDKLLFGIILGSILFAAAAILHTYLRKKNGGKSYFQGQKIAFPIAILIIASVVLYYTYQLI